MTSAAQTKAPPGEDLAGFPEMPEQRVISF